MQRFEHVKTALAGYQSLEGAKAFFEGLGYQVIQPLPSDLSRMPEGAREAVRSAHQLVHLGDGSPFRIHHIELNHDSIRRSDIRRFLEAFYRHQPQGENLFVFSPTGSFEDLAFVSARRLLDPRGSGRVRLWLRILQVRREKPYRTDLEVLDRIRVDGTQDPQKIWDLHDEAFSVQRVTEQFFRDYSEVFSSIRKHL